MWRKQHKPSGSPAQAQAQRKPSASPPQAHHKPTTSSASPPQAAQAHHKQRKPSGGGRPVGLSWGVTEGGWRPAWPSRWPSAGGHGPAGLTGCVTGSGWQRARLGWWPWAFSTRRCVWHKVAGDLLGGWRPARLSSWPWTGLAQLGCDRRWLATCLAQWVAVDLLGSFGGRGPAGLVGCAEEGGWPSARLSWWPLDRTAHPLGDGGGR